MSNSNAEIRVYDPTSLALLAVFDDYETAYFQRSWNSVGDFNITINANTLWASSLQRQRLIQIQGDRFKTGIITAVNQPLTEDGKPSQQITATGYELKGIFKRRLVAIPSGSATYDIASSPAETIMKTLAGTEIGPSATIAARRIANILINTDAGRGSSYAYTSAFSQSLADACEQVSLASNLGWYCYLDLTLGKIVFDCAVGVTRTSDQTAGQAIFAAERRTIKSGNVKTTDDAYFNFAFVGGSGSGAARIFRNVPNSSPPSGIDRYELFVDASNFSSNLDLDNQGNQKLNEASQLVFVDGQGLPTSPLVYQTDYDLGDVATIYLYGNSIDSRIVGARESWGKLDYGLDLSFGKPYPTLPWQTKRGLNRLQNGINA